MTIHFALISVHIIALFANGHEADILNAFKVLQISSDCFTL